MALKISLKKKITLNNVKNFVLFCDNNFNISGLDKIQIKIKPENIKKTINSIELKKNNDIFAFNINPSQKIILIKIEDSNLPLDNEKKGAKFYDFMKKNQIASALIIEKNFINFYKKNFDINEFLHGSNLKSYEFKKYKSNKKTDNIEIDINTANSSLFINTKKKLNPLIEGINFTKELVSEPGNILHPDEYVRRLRKLTQIGLKVTVYDKKKLKNLNMNALLGVGQGSIRGSYLVTLEWQGSKKNKPLAFVGKGVCFDTGGISLKPAKFMEDMTYDMAGSAVVVGLMKTLALKKSKVNAVGVVGLVENMPDGNAQRPGDIVKSFSGKTIEILNTDAEGRLVLADALTFTEKKFKPRFIVDLATLTGAIIVSLGSEYAGLFSNDDKLSSQLFKAGEKVGEKVWRMPLHKNYDQLINSKNADMQNINYIGGAGSTTAAQFLQRFILNKTPWAHLDIAGMAFSKYGGALNSGGATGYGVRLLNKLIEEYYE